MSRAELRATNQLASIGAHTPPACPATDWEAVAATTTMSSSALLPGDDPRDPSAETPLTLPEKWQTESVGECQHNEEA